VISDFDEHAPSNAALTSVIMAFVEGLLAQSTV